MPDTDSLAGGPPKRGGCLTVLGWVIAAGVLTLALTALLFWRMSSEVTDKAVRMAEAIAARFDQTLNFTPEVQIDSVVVVSPHTPIFELVTVQRQDLVRHRWSHTWMHSTKIFELEATFTAKAGFDLTEPFRIRIDPRSQSIAAELPQPKILTVSMSNLRILEDEDGYWNRLTASDREEAIRQLEAVARKTFASSNLLLEARSEAEKQVREILKRSQEEGFSIPQSSPEEKP